jgi:hypothetical protein
MKLHIKTVVIILFFLKHDKTLPLKGRSGILGELRNHTFCDVACGLGDNSEYTYCVTTAGALCSFNAKRNLEKFVELGVSTFLCLFVLFCLSSFHYSLIQ